MSEFFVVSCYTPNKEKVKELLPHVDMHTIHISILDLITYPNDTSLSILECILEYVQKTKGTQYLSTWLLNNRLHSEAQKGNNSNEIVLLERYINLS